MTFVFYTQVTRVHEVNYSPKPLSLALGAQDIAQVAMQQTVAKSKSVDLRGFDPRTSSLLTRRTTDCSTNPCANPHFLRYMYLQVIDAEAEAKDNVQYLLIIQRSCSTLQQEDPRLIMTVLPAILSECHTMHTMARYNHFQLEPLVYPERRGRLSRLGYMMLKQLCNAGITALLPTLARL